MFCDQCGEKLQANQSFCSRCGREVIGVIPGYPRRSRVQEILAVMFADPKDIEAHLVSVLDLFDQVSKALRRTECTAGFVMCGRKAINSDFHTASAYGYWSASRAGLVTAGFRESTEGRSVFFARRRVSELGIAEAVI